MPDTHTARLRIAEHRDAEQIHELAISAFGETTFLYTIYQAPQSVEYIKRLIDSGGETHRFVVMERESELVGYYHALIRGDDYFLNYIATDATQSGRGMGRLLLRNFEETARTLRRLRLALDVFESNTRAVAWYRRDGYQQHSAKYLARVALRDLSTHADVGLDLDSQDLDRALAEESIWGFSKIQCRCGTGSISLGLIGGRVCKLLEFEGLTLWQAMTSIAARLRSERELLIIAADELPKESWPLISSEVSLRMLKPAG